MVFKKDYRPEVAVLLATISIFYTQYTTYLNNIRPITPVVVYVQDPSVSDSARSNVNRNSLNCMTEAIYYEARNQPTSGQRAVGHVIMNRVKEGFANSVCGVVQQGCQFSYRCEKHGRPADRQAWNKAEDIARDVLAGANDITYGSTFYHAKYVEPYWANKMKLTVDIGDHLFYNDV